MARLRWFRFGNLLLENKRSDVVLGKFVLVRVFKVKEAFAMENPIPRTGYQIFPYQAQDVRCTCAFQFFHVAKFGIYGSCAMNIDGCNGLACLTKIQSEGIEASTITPLLHMFIVKDLVIDMTNFYNQYKSIEPWLKRKRTNPNPRKEILQSKEGRKKLDGMYECIL